MAVTVYSDIILSHRKFAAGVRGRQVRRNSRVGVDSGQMAINIVWTQTLREFEVGFIPMERTLWQDLETIHEVTEGGAYGFLLQDPKDSAVETGEGVVYALTSTTFQAYKRYLHDDSGRYKDRKLTRLDEASVAVFVSGSPATFTVDPDTGIITISSAPSAAAVTWTGNFYIPVHFMDDTIDWEIVGSGATAEARYVAGPSVVLREIRE
jgi:uncharacterized protein (TIGR02217 family)